MTQAPRRLSDASSTGSSVSVRLFDRPETSPCASSDYISIHDSNLLRVQDLLESSRRRQPGDVHARRSLRKNRLLVPSAVKRGGVRSGELRWKRALEITTINPATLIASRTRYRGLLGTCLTIEVCDKFCLAICINFNFTCNLDAEYNYRNSLYSTFEFFENCICDCIIGFVPNFVIVRDVLN